MSLIGLNYDVLFNLAQFLDIDDLVNFGRSCKTLLGISYDAQVCRQVIQNSVPYSLESKLVKSKEIDYARALHRVHRRREAFASGIPVAANFFPAVSQFVYGDGILCFISNDRIHILNIVGTGEIVLPFDSILHGSIKCTNDETIRLIEFSDTVLSIVFQDMSTNDDYLLLFRVDIERKSIKLLRTVFLQEGSSRLFVRCTKDYVYYGTHTRLGSGNCYEWVLQGISLNPNKRFPKESRSIRDNAQPDESRFITLNGFSGPDIGSQIAFKIHDGYLYAITNGDDCDVVEIDWTSVYRCLRFPIDNPSFSNVQINGKLFRRQHEEGPLNDAWTNITLQVDERTNNLMIIEARMEWLKGKSSQSRSFYITHIDFSDCNNSAGFSPPENDLLTPLATVRSKYVAGNPREIWQVHQEEANLLENRRRGEMNHSSSFIPTHTKLKTYDLSSNSFVDIVADYDCCLRTTNKRSRPLCLRIRTGSRSIGPLQPGSFKDASSNVQPHCKTETITSTQLLQFPKPDQFHQQTCQLYNYSTVHMWPNSLPAGKEDITAHEILNADTTDPYTYDSGVQIQGATDERTIIYLMRDSAAIRTNESSVKGKLVILAFDRDASIGKLDMLSKPSPEQSRCTSSGLKNTASSIYRSTSRTCLLGKRKWVHEEFCDINTKLPCTRAGSETWLHSTLAVPPEHLTLDFDDEGWGLM